MGVLGPCGRWGHTGPHLLQFSPSPPAPTKYLSHFWASNSGSSDFPRDGYGFLASEWLSLKFYLSKSQIPIVGKDNARCSLWTPPQSPRNGPWAWNTSLPRDEEPTWPGQGFPLVWEYSSLFQAQWVLFCFCLKCVQHRAAAQPHHLSVLRGRGHGCIHCCISRVRVELPCTGHRRDPLAVENWCPQLKLTCSVSSPCKYSTVPPSASSHWAFLHKSRTTMQWADMFQVSPGTDDQYTTLCLTHLLRNYKQIIFKKKTLLSYFSLPFLTVDPMWKRQW